MHPMVSCAVVRHSLAAETACRPFTNNQTLIEQFNQLPVEYRETKVSEIAQQHLGRRIELVARYFDAPTEDSKAFYRSILVAHVKLMKNDRLYLGGFLWRAEKNDKTADLIGSMHATLLEPNDNSSPSFAPFAPEVWASYFVNHELRIEYNIFDGEELCELIEAESLPEIPKKCDLPAELVTLSFSGHDYWLMRTAIFHNKKIISLESAKIQAEAHILSTRIALANPDFLISNLEDSITTIDAVMYSNLASIQHIASTYPTPIRAHMHKRNKVMAAKIAADPQGCHVVGGMHLDDERKSINYYLRKKGFTVTQIPLTHPKTCSPSAAL